MTKRLLAALVITLGLTAAARAQDEPPAPPATPMAPTSSVPTPSVPTPSAPPPSVPTPSALPPKPAGAASEFGDRGQVAIGVDVPFQNEAAQLALIRSSVSMGGSTRTIVVVQPSADYFFMPHFSIGGIVGYARGDIAFGGAGVSSDHSVTEVLVGVRAGYDVHMTDLVSIWGKAEIIYANISGAGSGYDIPVIVNIPVLLHPASHFFLGVGPTFSRDLVAKVGGRSVPTTTNYGLQGIIGGYFGD